MHALRYPERDWSYYVTKIQRWWRAILRSRIETLIAFYQLICLAHEERAAAQTKIARAFRRFRTRRKIRQLFDALISMANTRKQAEAEARRQVEVKASQLIVKASRKVRFVFEKLVSGPQKKVGRSQTAVVH